MVRIGFIAAFGRIQIMAFEVEISLKCYSYLPGCLFQLKGPRNRLLTNGRRKSSHIHTNGPTNMKFAADRQTDEQTRRRKWQQNRQERVV